MKTIENIRRSMAGILAGTVILCAYWITEEIKYVRAMKKLNIKIK